MVRLTTCQYCRTPTNSILVYHAGLQSQSVRICPASVVSTTGPIIDPDSHTRSNVVLTMSLHSIELPTGVRSPSGYALSERRVTPTRPREVCLLQTSL